MYCKYLSKTLRGKFKCKKTKNVITPDECKKCLDFQPHASGTIKKQSNKRITVTDATYQAVLSRDKRCRLQGQSRCEGGLELHHIRYRSERKDLINEPSNCIMLCVKHHRLVHSNKKKWQPTLIEMMEEKQ